MNEQSDRGEMGHLARRLVEDVGQLAKDHVELARHEIGTSLRKTTIDMIAIVLGGVVALIGLGMACVSLVVALAPILPSLWLRLLLCAVGYLILGGAVVGGFVKKLRGDSPAELDRSKRQAQLTVRAIEREVQHG